MGYSPMNIFAPFPFIEDQKFTQWWLWLFLTAIGLFPIYAIYKQLILGEKFGDKPIPDFGLVLMSFFIYVLLAVFYLMRLKTEIDQQEIRINFFPFTKKKTKWKDIKTVLPLYHLNLFSGTTPDNPRMVVGVTKKSLYLVVAITKSHQHVYNHLTGNGKNHRKIK